ncbi:MAG: HPr family phosphocarrier protein [Bacteriovoracaceae bacterium]
MIKTKITIIKNSGLHARPAAELVKLATSFESEIEIEGNDDVADAKSIMGIMGLALVKGSEITLSVSGNDEKAAMESLKNFLSSP